MLGPHLYHLVPRSPKIQTDPKRFEQISQDSKRFQKISKNQKVSIGPGTCGLTRTVTYMLFCFIFLHLHHGAWTFSPKVSYFVVPWSSPTILVARTSGAWSTTSRRRSLYSKPLNHGFGIQWKTRLSQKRSNSNSLLCSSSFVLPSCLISSNQCVAFCCN